MTGLEVLKEIRKKSLPKNLKNKSNEIKKLELRIMSCAEAIIEVQKITEEAIKKIREIYNI